MTRNTQYTCNTNQFSSSYISCRPQYIRVYASKIKNTNIVLFRDDIVTIESINSVWYDATIKCDANGWNHYLLNNFIIRKLKDVPNENFMKMCARINGKVIPVGDNHTFVCEEDGVLSLFGNDVVYMRWNNSGYIDVKITIKRPA